MLPDDEALARFGIEVESERGALLREGGFTVVDRYDGHTPPGPESGYAAWLRERGYGGSDPWSEHVIGVDAGGAFASGWQMRNVHLPSRVAEPHSETAYMTDLALDWIRAQGEAPWVLHLSYVKPHWPYVAPAPYHAMFRGADVGPIRHGPQDGTADEHPVVRAYRAHDECESFAREDVARHVRPAYMGLIAQLDHHLGRVLDALTASGRIRDTLIVFASDHGEFGGDRGLGEKELFYDEIVRVPFIVCDPDPRADATRGHVESRFVEGIDVVPTILDALGVASAPHRIEGRSLLPLTRGEPPGRWRDAVFSELDYGFRRARRVLGRGVRDCRAIHGAHQGLEVRPLGRFPAATVRPRSRPARAPRCRRRPAARCRPRGHARAALRLDGDREAPDDRHRRGRRKPDRCPSGARHPYRYLVSAERGRIATAKAWRRR